MLPVQIITNIQKIVITRPRFSISADDAGNLVMVFKVGFWASFATNRLGRGEGDSLFGSPIPDAGIGRCAALPQIFKQFQILSWRGSRNLRNRRDCSQ